MKPVLSSPRAAGLGFAGFLVCVGIRAVAFGVGVRDRAHFGIGGSTAPWEEVSTLLTALEPLVVIAALAAVTATWVSRLHRQALFALIFLVVANVGSWCAKVLATWVLPEGRGTLPSGHTTLALTSAAVVVVLTPATWRVLGVPVAGFLGASGPLGVIAALWHTPCDPAAALALMPLWLWVSTWLTQRMLGLRNFGRTAPPSRRPLPPRHLASETRSSDASLLVLGAASLAVMLAGWGFEPERISLGDWLLGASEFVLLPLLAVAVLVDVARVAEELGSPKH